ncbi:VOC family protein [Clostridia bacterium]|nr:VOC family protein [Clostridia bacterium]
MIKTFTIFINFDGNCREALEFYTKIFQSEAQDIMTYDQMSPDQNFSVADVDKKKIMYSSIPIFGCHVMFSDVPSDMPLTKGDNISPTLSSDDKEEIQRIFTALSEGGTVMMPLNKTFWSESFGVVQDKYGIIWQLSHSQ